MKLLHFPNEFGLMIMQIFDYLPFLLAIFVFKVRKSKAILPNSPAFWIIILLFLILSMFTTLYHGGAIFSAISHFGAMFRFVPLALIIWIIRPAEKEILLFYDNFVKITLILVSIGYIEIFFGASARNFFLPLAKNYSSANITDGTDISGIFPNTVDYSYFLLISYIIIANRIPRKHQFILFSIYLVPIYFSGSKASLIIYLLCFSFRLENARLIKSVFITGVCLTTSVLIYQFWELFYWTAFIDSQSSRLGYIIFTFPSFIQEMSFDTLFGVSPDRVLAFNKINSYPNAPMMTWELDSMSSFEDEFYVALPVYYGILGFSLIICLFIGMYKSFTHANWTNQNFNYPIIIKSLFSILVIAPLFNQIIILKPFTIFFWCWIGIFLTQMNLKVVPSK